jgi:hypothetical protein
MSRKIVLFEAGNCCGFERDPKESQAFDLEWNHLIHNFPKDTFQRWNTMNNRSKFNQQPEIARLMGRQGKGILPVLMINDQIIMLEKYPTYFEVRDVLNAI